MAIFNGTPGIDRFTGGSAADLMHGQGGDDFLYGGSGNDDMFGGTGDDALTGGSGRDELYGESGADRLSGGGDDDELDGGSGADWLSGDSGDDELNGGSNSDELHGGSGDDYLEGDSDGGGGPVTHAAGVLTLFAAGDWLWTGSGRDVIFFDGNGDDHDVVADFELGWDRLEISDVLSVQQFVITDGPFGAGLLIITEDTAGNDDGLFLQGLTAPLVFGVDYFFVD